MFYVTTTFEHRHLEIETIYFIIDKIIFTSFKTNMLNRAKNPRLYIIINPIIGIGNGRGEFSRAVTAVVSFQGLYLGSNGRGDFYLGMPRSDKRGAIHT